MTLKNKVNEEQYKTIKRYLIGSVATYIATTITAIGIIVGSYVSTNQRIDTANQRIDYIYERLEKQTEINYEMLKKIDRNQEEIERARDDIKTVIENYKVR